MTSSGQRAVYASYRRWSTFCGVECLEGHALHPSQPADQQQTGSGQSGGWDASAAMLKPLRRLDRARAMRHLSVPSDQTQAWLERAGPKAGLRAPVSWRWMRRIEAFH